MACYEITMSPEGREVGVLLKGPGICQDGRRYVFANTDRSSAFVEALNFAYQQGLRDGARRARTASEPLTIVSGLSPDNLRLRTETFWERTLRRVRTLTGSCA